MATSRRRVQPSRMLIIMCVTNVPVEIDGVSHPVTDMYSTIEEDMVTEEVVEGGYIISTKRRPMTRNHQDEIRAIAQNMQRVRAHARNR